MIDRLTTYREKIIWVEEVNAIVFLVREPGHLWGDCEVVYGAGEPSWRGLVNQTGETWAFHDESLGASPDRKPPRPPLLRTLWRRLRGFVNLLRVPMIMGEEPIWLPPVMNLVTDNLDWAAGVPIAVDSPCIHAPSMAHQAIARQAAQ